MARISSPSRTVTLGDLQGIGRFLRYAVIPFLAMLLAAAVWAHDTNQAVTELQAEIPAARRLERKVDSLSWKIDLLLDDRGVRVEPSR